MPLQVAHKVIALHRQSTSYKSKTSQNVRLILQLQVARALLEFCSKAMASLKLWHG